MEFQFGLHAASSMRPSAARKVSNLRKLILVVRTAGDLENREECFLRNVDTAHALHAFLSLFLLFEEFAFARDVAAIAFRDHVLADGADRLARDDARSEERR